MGYEIERFLTKIDDELICGICHDVLKEPLKAKKCNHLFCSECINGWLGFSQTCPMDRKKLVSNDLIKPCRQIINILANLDIKCQFFSMGCTVLGKVSNIDNHMAICPYNSQLPFKCDCRLYFAENAITDHQLSCVEFLRNHYINSQSKKQFF
jgi:E3 ubiquitin-protein ligase NRDP1